MSFALLQFADPRWLWLALLGPIALFALQAWSARARRRQLERLAAPEALADLTRSHSPMRRRVKEILLLVTLAAFLGTIAESAIGATLEQRGWVGNEAVNFLNTLCGAGLAALFIFLFSR